MIGLVIERSIIFGLRAAITSEPRTAEGFSSSEGLMEYMQTSLFMGILPVAQDLSRLVRTILVNATYGSEAVKDIPRLQEYLPKPSKLDVETTTKFSSWRDDVISTRTRRTTSMWSFSGTTVVEDDDEDSYPDHPRQRFWFRRMHNAILAMLTAVFVMGLLGNCRLIVQRNDPTKLRENEILRYVSTTLSVLVLLFLNTVVIWALVYVPRMNRQASKYVFLLSALLLVPAMYRFTVMTKRTTAYWSDERSAQNGLRDKALFYIIDILPEWSAVFIFLCIDVRKVFQTGSDGDILWWDETPEEKEKRLLREKEKELQKGNGLITVPVISRLSRGRFVLPLITS